MEFPHLGDHCSKAECKRLDFLPLKCDACMGLYCSDHITYVSHSCKECYKKDNQVPVCPLCNKPIPLMPGEQVDRKVGAHIDTDCQSDPAKDKRKIYTNRCSHKGCKVKELVPFACEKCHKNYCLKHRHELDHKCKGFEDLGRSVSKAGAAAITRLGGAYPKTVGAAQSRSASTVAFGNSQSIAPAAASTNSYSAGASISPALNEDEALAFAMQISLQESEAAKRQSSTEQEAADGDEALARAIHQSQLEERRRQQQQRQAHTDDSRCTVS